MKEEDISTIKAERCSMSSPFLLAQAHARRVSENGSPVKVVKANGFSFTCKYPIVGYTNTLSFSYEVLVEWDPKDSAMYLTTKAKKLRLKWWDDVHHFFDHLDRCTKLFLSSQFELMAKEVEENEEVRGYEVFFPTGTLFAERQGNERLVPRFEAFISYEDEKLFENHFLNTLSYSCQALQLCRPVFFFIAVHGRRPSKDEVFHSLIKAYSESQVLREDSDFGMKNPPPLFFPEGLYDGKIYTLQPQ